MSANNDEKPSYTFEEYKLYYETTEKVTQQRLETNRWNYSICAAIFVGIAALMNWSVSTPAFFVVGVIIAFLLCGLGSYFCVLWRRQIIAAKLLNQKKFED